MDIMNCLLFSLPENFSLYFYLLNWLYNKTVYICDPSYLEKFINFLASNHSLWRSAGDRKLGQH